VRSRVVATLVALAVAGICIACGTTEDTADSDPTSGCAAPDADFAAQGADGRFTSGGVERTFSIAVPDDEAADRPAPLIVDMHGARATAEQHEDMTGLGIRGPQQGYVVVAPQALGQLPIWTLGSDGSEASGIVADGPDITFVRELVDEVERRLCIDRSQVYLSGFSMGGMLAMQLACAEPDRFAAIATVSGEVDVDNCAPEERPPLVAFQGTADEVVRFDGTLPESISFSIPYYQEPPRDEIVRRWAEASGCAVPPSETPIPPDVEHQVYDCPGGGVEMYVIEGGGHTWPGSTPGPFSDALAGPTSQTVDATELILAFFGGHTRSS
jgi:polyhydroxybutyrate depolymerase